MPANTAVPSDWRISAPAPVATASGATPSMKAKDVIRIGRKRSTQASKIASAGGNPRSRSACRAKSTSMMPFFFTIPISRMMPITAMMPRS